MSIKADEDVSKAVELAMRTVPKGLHYPERLAIAAIGFYEPKSDQPVRVSLRDAVVAMKREVQFKTDELPTLLAKIAAQEWRVPYVD